MIITITNTNPMNSFNHQRVKSKTFLPVDLTRANYQVDHITSKQSSQVPIPKYRTV